MFFKNTFRNASNESSALYDQLRGYIDSKVWFDSYLTNAGWQVEIDAKAIDYCCISLQEQTQSLIIEALFQLREHTRVQPSPSVIIATIQLLKVFASSILNNGVASVTEQLEEIAWFCLETLFRLRTTVSILEVLECYFKISLTDFLEDPDECHMTSKNVLAQPIYNLKASDSEMLSKNLLELLVILCSSSNKESNISTSVISSIMQSALGKIATLWLFCLTLTQRQVTDPVWFLKFYFVSRIFTHQRSR